jgi:aspartoacylase
MVFSSNQPTTKKSKKVNMIKQIVISGGTHGNEMSGIQAVKQWQKDSSELQSAAPSATINLALVNIEAIGARIRYIDEDLNRQFSNPKLREALQDESPKEAKLAHAFNAQYGPKGNSSTDFSIDIHNTTSNMGPTLIILVNDSFHQQLARFVKNAMPAANILVEDYQAFEEFAYLCTVAKKGVMIEVGPQVHGTLKALAYQQTLDMTYAILTFIEQYNQGTLAKLPPVEAFRLGTEIAYPVDENNHKTAMIHPAIDGKDFVELLPKQACFVDYAGEEILWEGELTYPHFIGEVAYDHLNIAFATASKCTF